QAGDVDRFVVGRIDAKLAEIPRARVAVADERPRAALVLGAQDPAALRVERGRRPARWRLRRLTARSATAAAADRVAAIRSAVVAPVESASASSAAGLRRRLRRALATGSSSRCAAADSWPHTPCCCWTDRARCR